MGHARGPGEAHEPKERQQKQVHLAVAELEVVTQTVCKMSNFQPPKFHQIMYQPTSSQNSSQPNPARDAPLLWLTGEQIDKMHRSRNRKR